MPETMTLSGVVDFDETDLCARPYAYVLIWAVDMAHSSSRRHLRFGRMGVPAMKKILAVVLGAVFAAGGQIFPASSNTFNFSFVDTVNSAYFGSGEFTTDSGGSPFAVMAISGFVNGSVVITGLSGLAGADAKLYYPASTNPLTGSFVTNGGISFSTSTLGDFNIYYSNSTYLLAQSSPCGLADCFNGDPIRFTVTETPLPAALPLFASGAAALGLLAWRRRRKVAVSVA